MEKEQKQSGYVVHCGNCGAVFDADYAYCPYCGRMNDPAAEREYMEHLEDIRQDVEELAEIPGEESVKVAVSQGKRAVKIVIVTLCIIGLLAGAFWLLNRSMSGSNDPKDDYLWQQENIPKMEACYEAEDYEGILALYKEAIDGGHSFYKWEHADFADLYYTCQTIQAVIDERDDSFDPDEMEDYEYGDLFYSEVNVLYRYENDETLDEEEKSRLAEKVEMVRTDLEDVYRMTEKQKAELQKTIEKDGYVSYGSVSDLARKWRKS